MMGAGEQREDGRRCWLASRGVVAAQTRLGRGDDAPGFAGPSPALFILEGVKTITLSVSSALTAWGSASRVLAASRDRGQSLQLFASICVASLCSPSLQYGCGFADEGVRVIACISS
jgi:hypothetical protein